MENLWEKIAINLADSQAPSLLVAEVDTAMNHNELVKLKVGEWLGDDLCHIKALSWAMTSATPIRMALRITSRMLQ